MQFTRDKNNFAQSLLAEAAHLWGIEQKFWDIWGIEHHAPPPVQKAILQSLGVDASSDESLERAILERRRRDSSLLLPPTLVIGQSTRTVPINVPENLGSKTVSLRFEWEFGDISELQTRIHEG